jgi:quinol monooxygenase YgiN
MTRINTGEDIVTLINVFTVEPSRQQSLVDLLTRATDETIRHLPGFVSANIHKSLDGTRVTNYAQWRSHADFEAMLRNPAAIPHLKEAAAIATSVEPHLYEIAEVRAVARRPHSIASGAAALGALAVGACAIGALAIGRLAIGALAVKRGHVRTMSIDDVAIGRLAVRELVVDQH